MKTAPHSGAFLRVLAGCLFFFIIHNTRASTFDGTATPWPGGNVYYTFDSSVSAIEQREFLDGAAEWALFANLHFIARSTQINYVTIVSTNMYATNNTEGGSSSVGMVGGQQFILYWFNNNAWDRKIVLHEIGHTLGLIHEQIRSDRDYYLTVITNNMIPGYTGLIKQNNTRNESPFDFLSVMMYDQYSGSINPPILPTMVPLPSYMQFANIFGQGDPILTPHDRAGMAAVYGPGPTLTNVVTNTQDSSPGSLRAALYYAYDHPGTVIRFNIPVTDPGFSNSVFNIQPTGVLPSLINVTTLDGTTEPTNSNPNGPCIMLNGTLAQISKGLRLRGTNCVVRGLVINGCQSAGISIDGSNSTENVISGCFLGLNPSGTVAIPNQGYGINISSGAQSNLIGGFTASARNVISGNGGSGVFLANTNTSDNFIAGNYIGLNAAGTASIPNGYYGVEFQGGSANIVGGNTVAARNVISGNGSSGVLLNSPNASGNFIVGNYIGLNSTGSTAIANAFAGIEIDSGASLNVIGGNSLGAGNIISGNGNSGILIRFAGTSGNVVQGNIIGLNSAGMAPVPNADQGINVYGGAQSNLIGGYISTARNIISGNNSDGVLLAQSNTTGNIVAGNYIGLNAAGSAAIPNNGSGVEINYGASVNTIGGISSGGNCIAGNSGSGIGIDQPGTTGNLVAGNMIGLNPTGSAAIANAFAGIEINSGAMSNVIGGNSLDASNMISGNGNSGMLIQFAGTSGNVVQGNIIGLNSAGTAAVPNAATALTSMAARNPTLLVAMIQQPQCCFRE